MNRINILKEKIIRETDLSESNIDRLVKKKQKELKGLLSIEDGLKIIARDYGVAY
jgi:F0F1-type ATP synthase epsilon subunit